MLSRSFYSVIASVLVALGSPLTTAGESAPAARADRAIEEEMAVWLAHPLEFGVRPTSVHLKHTYKVDLVTYGKKMIHLVEYTMPDGTTGRGFVNGGLTWSFIGPEVNAIKDDDLFVAYCGWAWLFPPLQAGTVKNQFTSSGEEAKYLAQKRKEGLMDLEVTSRLQIGTIELTEFEAKQNGKAVRGAGDTQAEIIIPASDPRYELPAIYFLLGQQAIESVH
jgi:hypothetical protein